MCSMKKIKFEKMSDKVKIEIMDLVLSTDIGDTVGFMDGKKHFSVVRDE
jgi:uncharacterized protein YwlG (UPF0340 family)